MPPSPRPSPSALIGPGLVAGVWAALSATAAAQTAPPMDRYGGGELYGAPVAAPEAAPVRRVSLSSPQTPYALRPRAAAPRSLGGLRTLSWAGKSDRSASAGSPPYAYAEPAPRAAWRAAPVAPRAAYAPAPVASAYAPAPRRVERVASDPSASHTVRAASPAQPARAAQDGWVPFDAAAYAAGPSAVVPRLSASPRAERWTPPPAPKSIYDAPPPAPVARAASPPTRPAQAPQPVLSQAVTPQAESPRPAQAAASTANTPRAARPAYASMPPPRGYRVAQADAAQADPYNGSGVRHYSVHREFGLRPDATPIPPQFFTATADLSAGFEGPEPSGPDPLARRTKTGLTSAQARATQATAATGTNADQL